MKRTVLISSLVGFSIPFFWGVAAFVLFNMKESAASNAFWASVYITCPLWFLPGRWGSIAMPVLNAALYGLIGFAIRSIAGRTSANR